MKKDWINSLVSFLALLLAQALICNHIHLFNCATPLLYVYWVLPQRRDAPKWAVLLACFALGLGVDVSANTPGVAAASMTLAGMMQPYVLALFIPYDSPDNFQPTFRTLGTAKYIAYTSVITLVHCLAFYSLELFNFYNIVQWLCCVGGSALLTLLLAWVVEILVRRQ